MPDSGGGRPRSLDTDLERRLSEAGRKVAFPPVPDLWPAISAEIQSPASRAGSLGSWSPWLGPGLRRLAVSIVIIIIALVGVTLVAFPEFRDAVASRFGLTGVDIHFLDEPPTQAPAIGDGLNLGRSVSLEEAAAAVDFPLRIATEPALGEPTGVYLTHGRTNQMVSMVYPAGDLLPASRFSGVGALLTQFQGSTERGMISKGLLVDSAVEAVSVNGASGFWIDGAAHFFMYRDPTGEFQAEDYRLAGNVLLWEEDGITYRLESELTRDAALSLATSLQPVPGTE